MGSPYKSVAFQTLGCKLNFTESSTLARDFSLLGFAQVGVNEPADLYVINTCSVTENANKKARKAVRQALRKSPHAKIAVIGCYAQLKPDEIAEIPGVNMVVGAEDKFNLPQQIEAQYFNGSPIILNSPIQEVNTFIPSYSMGERTRSYLKVQDGCDYTCSFCTIPLARGKSRSANIQDTLSQAKEIAETDTREVVLTGVNVGDFGKDHGEDLLGLISQLDKLNGIDRFRISSIEPNLLSDEIIQFMLQSNKFLPHFHIPLQSGANSILKAMRRRYNRELYSKKVNTIKTIYKDACIGVDVIVGFPGELETEFRQTYDFLNEINISYLHVFSYSQRENTDAIDLEPKIANEKIMQRSKILHELSNEKRRKYFQQNLGNKQSILIENYENGVISGYSENYITVSLPGTIEDLNSIIPVKLVAIENDEMIGERSI